MGNWIVIPNWDSFQHYRHRRPRWIKLYADLLSDPDWLGLTWHQRGILVSLWLEYATSRGQVPDNTASLSRRLNGRVTKVQLDALKEAGFIDFSASRPLAIGYQDASLELEKDLETPKPPFVDNSKARGAGGHDKLLLAAVDFVSHWNGGGSDDFDQGLADLEREFRSRLTTIERDKLWDQAFGRKR